MSSIQYPCAFNLFLRDKNGFNFYLYKKTDFGNNNIFFPNSAGFDPVP
jgi:hypothetical protein